MGCTSSTQYQVDPVTGQEKKKKKLGGAYPGQRRPQNQPHVPSASQFGPDGKATVHFVAYGGGNALTLVQQDGSAQPAVGQAEPQYIQVTLPDGVSEGQTIHVQAPDGKVNAIVIPPGFGPGSTFTVEFAPDTAPPPPKVNHPVATSTPAPVSTAPANNNVDDGFATGFNNPGWTPPPPQPVTATAVAASTEPDVAVYPTTTAKPVYPSAPTYPSS